MTSLYVKCGFRDLYIKVLSSPGGLKLINNNKNTNNAGGRRERQQRQRARPEAGEATQPGRPARDAPAQKRHLSAGAHPQAAREQRARAHEDALAQRRLRGTILYLSLSPSVTSFNTYIYIYRTADAHCGLSGAGILFDFNV